MNINQVTSEIKKDIRDLKREIRSDMREMRTNLKEDINEVRKEIKGLEKVTTKISSFVTVAIFLVVEGLKGFFSWKK